MRRHFLAASFCAADRLVSATHDGQRERSAENNIYAIKCLMRQPLANQYNDEILVSGQ